MRWEARAIAHGQWLYTRTGSGGGRDADGPVNHIGALIEIDDRFAVAGIVWQSALHPWTTARGLLLVSFIPFRRLRQVHQSPEQPTYAIEELEDKTRKSPLVTTVLIGAPAITRSEWLSIATDYVGPQLNHTSGEFLGHQVRRSMISQ